MLFEHSPFIAVAVLTGDGCITFLDVLGCQCVGQLQLSFPGCRASTFSMTPVQISLQLSAAMAWCGCLTWRWFVPSSSKASGGACQWPSCRSSSYAKLPASAEQDIVRAVSSSETAAARPGSSSTATGVLTDVVNLQPSAERGPPRKPPVRQKDGAAAGKVVLRTKLLSAPASYLNRRKLQELLMVYGEFPARYGQLIW